MKEFVQEELDKTIGERIYILRKKAKMTQSELCQLLYIDRSTISKFETGERRPTISQLMNLCEKLDTSIFYLLGMTDYSQSNAKYIDETKLIEIDEYETTLNTILPFINALKEVSSKYSPEQQDKFAHYVYQALKSNKK